jgi:formylglycine-generating enzyme required for sulfatase activity
MDQRDKEIITNNTSLTTQPGGLASRGLQIANKLAEQNAKTVKQLIDEKYFTNSLGMKFRLIPAGTFIMGSPEFEGDFDYYEEDQNEVTISKSFWMGVHEVTQKQYEKVMGTNPSWFQGHNVQGDNSNHPVENVLWDEAVKFCKRLSELPLEEKAGRIYRLPTEAEWEYACRAGSTTAFSFGDDSQSLGEYAWFKDNSNNQTHPVGEKKSNAWCLYDMHGNVLEWCSDEYDFDPTGLKDLSVAPNRGGCCFSPAEFCRSASQNRSYLTDRFCNQGFRVALSSSGIPK